MKKFIHIVNPVKVDKNSDLYVAQRVTFNSMLMAKAFLSEAAEVDLCAVGYPEDNLIAPTYIRYLDDLQQSILDVASFKSQRKLPLIKDILDAAVKSSDAEYVIYSNVDISLMPYFYEAVAEELKNHDALIINRRTIAKSDTADLPLTHFYQQIGEIHPGYDCFVFRKELYESFFLGNACIGANWIGRVLICNLLAHADSARIIEDSHLTFHLGDDRSWKTAANTDYDEFNESVVAELIQKVKQQGLLGKHPLLQRTYDEFFLKSTDPDPSRHKSSHASDDDNNVPKDLSLLPTRYLPSSSWESIDNLALRQDPVFIVGYPRSGTTLLQSLVATQYTPAIFPETHFFSIALSKLVIENDLIQPECVKELLEFLDEKLELSENFKQYVTGNVGKRLLSPKMLFEAIVYDKLSEHLSPEAIPKISWLEKTPDHVEHLDVIQRFYPAVKFIFVVRDPEKAILSRRKHFTWNDEVNWPIEKHVNKWLSAINYAENYRKKNPGKIIIVRFEDLVGNKRQEIEKICAFLDIEFRSNLINKYPEYSKQQNLEWETWKADTVRPINERVGNYSETLSTHDSVVLHNMAGAELAKYGYVQGTKIGEVIRVESFFTRGLQIMKQLRRRFFI